MNPAIDINALWTLISNVSLALVAGLGVVVGGLLAFRR